MTNLQLLINTLKSGQYLQGVSNLCVQTKTGREYCIAGLACEIFRQNTSRGKWVLQQYFGYSFKFKSQEDNVERFYSFSTPLEVNDFFGYDINLLSRLNDAGHSFIELSSILERWLVNYNIDYQICHHGIFWRYRVYETESRWMKL